jgi:hypothetical protein
MVRSHHLWFWLLLLLRPLPIIYTHNGDGTFQNVRMCFGSAYKTVCFSCVHVFCFPCRKCTKWNFKREELVSERVCVLCLTCEMFTATRLLVAWISFWFVSIQLSPLFKIKMYHIFFSKIDLAFKKVYMPTMNKTGDVITSDAVMVYR